MSERLAGISCGTPFAHRLKTVPGRKNSRSVLTQIDALLVAFDTLVPLIAL